MMEIDMKKKIALVIGATGGIGSEVATRLSSAGWQVRALNRNTQQAATNGHFT